MARKCRSCAAPAVVRGRCLRCAKRARVLPAPRPSGRPKNRKPDPAHNNREWRALSAAFLRENVWCASCLRAGRHVEATVADHVLPVRTHPHLAREWGNLQALCARRPYSCHQKKTGAEQRGVALDFRRGKRYALPVRRRTKIGDKHPVREGDRAC